MAAASTVSSVDFSSDENALPQKFNAKATICNRPVTRRAALSTINDNIEVCYKKLGVSKTDLQSTQPVCNPSLKQPKAAFVIFEDQRNEKLQDQAATALSESSVSLPTTVTQLYKYSAAFEALSSKSSDAEASETSIRDSPMLLDTSCCGVPSTYDDHLFNAVEYDEDIYAYLRTLELNFRPKPHYMKKQPDITHTMRSVLVDWLVDVVESYKMQTPTLYLAVSYTDRFLSQMSVLRGKLQLVGTSCLFVASKYEEIYPPELKEFVYVTDDTYNKKQVLRMEHLILKVLAFDLSAPTAYDFLQRFFAKCGTKAKTQSLAEYICELSLLDAEVFLPFLPSIIAASSLCLANYALEFEPWSADHERSTGYYVDDLEDCIKCLHRYHRTISDTPYRAITEKYRSHQHHCVAEIKLPSLDSSENASSR